MPRFYFDFEIGENSYSDDQGVELESLEIARRATIRILPALVQEELTGVDCQEVRLKIRDENGVPIWIENISRKDLGLRHLNADRPEIYTSRGH